MNLTLFFRLIVMSIFQHRVVSRTNVLKDSLKYRNCSFFCPKVYAKDGFYASLQITYGHHCESENGEQQLGHTFLTVECAPAQEEELLKDYYDYEAVPISVLEQVFEKHGGIDWEKTISVEQYHNVNFRTEMAK